MRIFLLFTCLIFTLSGCATPLVIFGASAAAGATLSKEQTIGSNIDDSAIWSKIKVEFTKHKEIEGILTSVSVEVLEGKVLLTGTVASAEDRLEIVKIVWTQNGVKEVINELLIRDSENSYGFQKYAQDSWITTQIKTDMLTNSDIRSINYNVETIDGVVYILGIAHNEAELDAVKNIAENTKNVTKVMSFVRIVNQEQKSQDESHEKDKSSAPTTKKSKSSENDEEYIHLGNE